MLLTTSYKSKPSLSASPIPGHPLAKRLVGCWLMNEGAGDVVFDSSFYRLDGTLASGVTRVGRGVSAASSSSIPVSSVESRVDLSTAGDLTIVFSLRSGGSSGAWHTIGFGDVAWTNYLLIRNDVDANQVQARLRGDSGNLLIVTSPGAISTAKFEALTLVKKGAVLHLYRNGVLVGSVGSQNYTIAANFNLGSALGPPTYGIDCEIEYSYIYSRALSASEIAWLYRQPFAMFDLSAGSELMYAAATNFVNLTGSASAQSSATAKVTIVGESEGIVSRKMWLKDALAAGMTANAFKLGTTLSLGWFWMRPGGCTALYRGPGMDQMDFGSILAVTESDAGSISPANYVSHNSNSTCFYVVRRFNQCGEQERTVAAAVKFSIDGSGDPAAAEPNKIFISRAETVNSDKIRLRWFYNTLEQKSGPRCFEIYYDDRSGQIDYENPIATVEYVGRRFYSYESDPLEAGRYLFAIRAGDVEGVENSSRAVHQIDVQAANPDAIEILSVVVH